MLQRHRKTLVVLLAVIVACAGGLGVAVVAFGQSTTDPTSDYTVPMGDYTSTTPGTIPSTSPPATLPPAETTERGEVPTTTTGRTSTRTQTPSGPTPSRVTRKGPTHLAFTGAEPLVVGLGGVTLMLAGFALQRRRRTGRAEG